MCRNKAFQCSSAIFVAVIGWPFFDESLNVVAVRKQILLQSFALFYKANDTFDELTLVL